MSTKDKENEVNPYNQKYTDTKAIMESAYETALNGNDEIAELNKQANDYSKLGSEYTRKYLNRDKFNYDINTDAMYAMFRDQYEKNAKLAQQEAQAAAAGLTGGYGSTYASAMGNRAYSAEMDKLNDKTIELYANAYNRYLQDGQDLLNQAALANSQAEALNTRAAGIRQDSLTTAALAGEYGNYLYSKSDEGIAAAEEEERNNARNDLNDLLTVDSVISSNTYKMQEDGKQKGYEGIANAIDLERDLIKNISKYPSEEKFVDELYDRLATVKIDGKPMTPQMQTVYVDWVLKHYDAQLPSWA